MKQKDLPLMFIVIIVSAIASLIIGKEVFATPKNRQHTVPHVTSISPTLSQPDPTYFSSSKGNYDPTQFITIGPNNNSNPLD